ncbi:putative oxidoreductase UxuB [Bremerella volcania]|uniref:Putative oxidoreductase UxuB n=1 Tax=Bremerella volcania TaxID=2527984 RepID=A0A518C7J3_9BACT|nr:SDR family oxidoreductase [Bremerella volcania]QDU75174.1 putative oxidoreductase UxuB [Bremerella volcania]
MATDFLTKMFGLDGQVAVVIGASGVLGGAIAEGLALAGATVVVSGLNPQRGESRVERITAAGGKAEFIAADTLSRDSLAQLRDKCLEKFGRVDMLVNCAGVNSSVPYEEITDEDWQRVLDTNLTGTHLACQVFAPTMAKQKQGGAVLNIGSVTAHLPLSRVFAYSASKAAVENLTKNLAREYATQNVRFNTLCPGFFPAEQNRKILDKERVDNIIGQTPMARFGEPEELVGASILLLSQAAGSFVTGATVYVDGGFTAMRF